tara:strand:+ start:7804 stop:8178 length:375 start_codon:yes stop_codon:yes gene_type:complete
MIFIEGNVPSSKNSKQWTGRMLIKSKATRTYEAATEQAWRENKEQFLDEVRLKPVPFRVGFYFVRGSRHKYDWVNPVQTIQDLMVKHEWMEDDNTTVMVPMPFKRNGVFDHYDKERPGVYIKVL